MKRKASFPFAFRSFIRIFAHRMKTKKILVVDDERDLCEIVLYNLTAAGYEAEAAHSAEEALQKIAEAEAIDLLLLDVMMPGMSGFELAARLKHDEQTAHIPIIFLTAKDTEDDMLAGFGLGADDYVKKPFSVREVTARVKFDLLRLLLSHRCQVFSRQELLDRVWPKDVIVTSRTVDVNITRMRKKIGRYGQCVVARQGFGYVFEERRREGEKE